MEKRLYKLRANSNFKKKLFKKNQVTIRKNSLNKWVKKTGLT